MVGDVSSPERILRNDIYEDAYSHTEGMIHQIVWKFQRRFGGDPDEWLSEANLIFMNTMESHDQNSSNLITWLYYRLHWGLYDVVKRRMRDAKHTPQIVYFDDVLTDDGRGADDIFPAPVSAPITSLMEHVSDSSRELWELILDPPEELKGDLDQNQPDASWDVIQRYCEWKLRWTWRQMQTAITELREICTE